MIPSQLRRKIFSKTELLSLAKQGALDVPRFPIPCFLIPMTTSNLVPSDSKPYVAAWTKLIAKAWVDPAFRAQLVANPAGVLLAHGIKSVAGQDLSTFKGSIAITSQASPWQQKPVLRDGVLTIPFPQAPRSYS